jgi:hypothetical protein
MAMTAGLLLFMACGEGDGGPLAGANKICGQKLACQAGESCKLGYLEWGYDCSCQEGKLVCESWASAAGPPSNPPSDLAVECSDKFCPDNEHSQRCSFSGPTCNYAVECETFGGPTKSVTGDCP